MKPLECTVRMNYALSHQEQIAAANFNRIGKWDGGLIYKDPTKHLFPTPYCATKQRIVLVHFRTRVRRQEILAKMDTFHARPVLSAEFFALVTQFPALLQRFYLVGFGSIWVNSGGNRLVLYTYRAMGGNQGLDLGWENAEWGIHCCFPAVRK